MEVLFEVLASRWRPSKGTNQTSCQLYSTESGDVWMTRTLSLPFRTLSCRYKIEHKVVEDINKLFMSSNTGEMLLTNNVMLVITTITDIPLRRLGESLNLYESLFPIISYICMLSWNMWAYFFFHLLYTFSCLGKSPGAGSLLRTSLVWNVVSYPQDSHALSKPARDELVKHHWPAVKWDRWFPHPIQPCVCVCFVQWVNIVV